MEKIKTACPLDCCDQCAFLVTEEGGKIVSIAPNPEQPVTGKVICSKGRRHLDRINHPERLLYPLLKRGGYFERVSWTEALQVVAEKINYTLKEHGPLALLHFFDGGYTGLLKKVESRFFSALGGSTVHQGSLCWGAGIAAQSYDFGAVQAHPYQDLVNSKLIIFWGRNPADTSTHILPFVRKARENGARVILIDPVQTATAALADQHIRVKPGSDGALALAMAKVIIKNELTATNFIKDHSSGFEAFAELCEDYSLQKVAGLTGLSAEVIEQLAFDYANSKPAVIWIGIGLQRHSNGGNIVRAIDALAALTGNLGVPGGGANYANFRISRYIDHDYMNGNDLAPQRRYYSKPKLAEALTGFEDPPITFLYNSRANPLVQVGDSNFLKKAFSKVPFIVTSEFFMTDTAAASDLVLPATYFLEDEDLYFTSMSHSYLTYGSQVVAPPGECRSEYSIFKELASLLDLKEFPDLQPEDLLARAIKPLNEATGITINMIKDNSPLLIPGGDDLPWSNWVFETADGKYNFYSDKASKEGGDGLPRYREADELSSRALHEEGFIYWFITPHPRDSIHATHRLPDQADQPAAYIHSQTAREENLTEGQCIRISSKRGSIEVKASISDRVPPQTVMVYEGWWHISGAAVNNLTPDHQTDLGNQAAYYDCLCRIETSV